MRTVSNQAAKLIRICQCLFFVGILLMFSSAYSQTWIIQEIRFEGNEHTRDVVLQNELSIEVGDSVTAEDLERSRQHILDLELFKSVKVSQTQEDNGIVVTFTVDEKRFWYVVPAFSRGSDGDITYGARLQMDNLFGLNKVLSIRARKKELKNTDIQSQESVDIEYKYPRVFSSKYDLQLRAELNDSDIEEERNGENGIFLREQVNFGLSLSRWLTTTGPSKGWRGSLGFEIDDYDHTFIAGNPDLFFDAQINALSANVEYIDITNHEYYRSGRQFGYHLLVSSDNLGSDVSFTAHSLFYRQYIPLNHRKYTNLNIQVRAGYTTRSIFGDATYQVASGRTIRGYERDSIEGNAFYFANVEYLTPLFGKHSLRGAVFLDAGDAADSIHDLDFSDVKFGTGVGLRWKIRSFVRTDIRIDIASGLNDGGETKVFAGTRTTF